MVPQIGFEPTRFTAPDPKSGAYANFATGAYMVRKKGLEPLRYYYLRILSPVRLPIPPLSQIGGESLYLGQCIGCDFCDGA